MNWTIARSALCASTCLLFAGCALLGKGDAMVPRHFTPDTGDRADASPAQTAPGRADAGGCPLRLGRVDSGSLLRERIVYRTSADEVGFYEDRRWTERPENYLQRALGQALFERNGFSRAVRGAAPTLQAELLAFEEVHGPPSRVRLELVFTLEHDGVTKLEQTLTVERALPPATGAGDPAAVARALGAALREAVDNISHQVLATLASPVGSAAAGGAVACGTASDPGRLAGAP